MFCQVICILCFLHESKWLKSIKTIMVLQENLAVFKIYQCYNQNDVHSSKPVYTINVCTSHVCTIKPVCVNVHSRELVWTSNVRTSKHVCDSYERTSKTVFTRDICTSKATLLVMFVQVNLFVLIVFVQINLLVLIMFV